MIFIFGLSENLDNDHELFTKFSVMHFLRQLGCLSNDFMFGLSEKLINDHELFRKFCVTHI